MDEEHYACNMVDCLRCIIPSGLKVKSQAFIKISPHIKTIDDLDINKKTEKEKEILLYLFEKDSYILIEDLLDLFGRQIN